MKMKDFLIGASVFGVFALLMVGLFMYGGPSEASVTGVIDEDTGLAAGPWANTIVQYKLSVKNEFTGADVAATAKVYDEMPEDWGNPRGDFDEASDYTSYTASSGYVTVNDEKPGTYYVVMTASSYNTEFVEMVIPDGSSRDIDVADYNSAPDIKSTPMSALGTTTDEDFALTLVNDTSAEIKEDVDPKIVANTVFKGWKVIVNDEEGFSLDTDGDGTYDEGITSFEVCVADACNVIFEPSKSIDEFDSNDEYTFLIEGTEIADENDLEISINIEAITGDYTGANDEVWGEGEGVLAYIKVYNMDGTLFTTADVTA